MAGFSEHLKATAEIIADYRAGEIPRPDARHIERWVAQFDENVRVPLLIELRHVLRKTYIPKSRVESFLAGLVTHQNLVGSDPVEFWKSVAFLNVQNRGNSQREFLSLFAISLKQKTGLELTECGARPACFVYLDDGIFTGMTLIQSMTRWLNGAAPAKAIVHVIVIAGHIGGKHYAETELQKVAKAAGKTLELHWGALLGFEDRKVNIDNSDVLRPIALPDDVRCKAYAAALKYPPIYRTAGKLGELNNFSTEAGRHLLEQQFLIKGCYIREVAPNLPKYARPLGDMVLETLGFGSTFVTYRNCPNNAPLAFWAGNPWAPLFPRKTN